jgi:hypothetical protein
VFAVGVEATIRHYNGSAWSAMPGGLPFDLYSVWGRSGYNVFAVGHDFEFNGGGIWRYNGGYWSLVYHTLSSLESVWGSSGINVFTVGFNGTVLHYTGSWTAMTSGTTNTLYGVWGSSGSDVFVVGNNGTILHYSGVSTLIELSSFTATPKAGEVILQWNTESETNNAGFSLYRSESENGEYIKINTSIIPAKGLPTQGASYEFTDTAVQNRRTYYYKLEDIDFNGISTMHGPVSATPRWIYNLWK